MLIDARELPRETDITTDVCIIGGGAAGITLARELDGQGLGIAVLESGGLEPDPSTQALYGGTLSGESFGVDDLESTRLRYLGGTTNHWSAQCRPFDAIDFERRDGWSPSGWPFGRDVLDPYYVRAREVCGLAPVDFDWHDLVDRYGSPPALIDDVTIRANPFVTSPVRFGVTYRDDLAESPDIDVYLWANVTDLPLGQASEAVDRVQAVTLTGNELVVRARVYVLATGGIENARTLLAANRDRPAGLGNEHDLVGRYFSEHLQMTAGLLLVDADATALALYESTLYEEPSQPTGEFAVSASLALTDEARRANDLLGVDVIFHPSPEERMRPAQPVGADSLDVGRLFGVIEEPPAAIALIRTSAEQGLHADSRVTLATETDALGIPRVDLHWEVTAADRANILDSLELIARRLGETGVARMQVAPGAVSRNPDAEDGDVDAIAVDRVAFDPEGFEVGIGSHHLCTTRMAASPTEGVVDADQRVHAVANLYVAGSSAFATGSAATPTFTIVALTLRLADHLRAELA
jgi:choline dehydrogenase-like flavoprotein